MPFRDRADAGRRLAAELATLDLTEPVVLGMARGGVAVAAEVARGLGAPLDVLVVRKLGYPRQPELALGAIGEGGVRVLNDDLIAQLRVTAEDLEAVASREAAELERRVERYRGGRPPLVLGGRTVVVVDDGLATGATARAALAVVRHLGARHVVLAVPVAAPSALAVVGAAADEIVCAEVSTRFSGISQCYDDFHQVSDDEVSALLSAAGSS